MIRTPKGCLNPESQQAFEELKKRFETWRAITRKGNRRVPEDLWASAAKLSAWFSVSSIAQALGIDFKTLKKRAFQQQNGQALEPQPATEFVEITRCAIPTAQSSQLAEIVSADGSVLRLYHGTVAEIIKAFKQS